ncbi:MAG: hypothetical protein JO244_07530, partial [Solirubrobacterales bacterium]|nr:hypothetical protein [Solirubrobacterales bacterium]
MLRVRLACVGGGLGWRGMVAGSALALAAAVAGAAAAPPAQAAPAGVGPVTGGVPVACGKAAGPFSVSGTQVLGAGGKPFVSYGLTVSGLQGPDWASFVSQDLQEIT